MKRSILVLGCLLCVTMICGVQEVSGQGRGFLLEAGVGGFPYLTYGSAGDTMLSSYRTTIGADRVQVYIDLSIGWALSETVYLVGTVDGFGDGFFVGGSTSDQLNSLLYSVGVRYYPFVTGLVLGASIGASRLVVTSDASAVGSTPWATGFGLGIAWDFGGKTGWTAEVGMKAVYLAVTDPVITNMVGITPFLNLVIK